MALDTYTSPAEIRSVLGVEEEELGNDTLDLPLYVSSLESELDEIDTGLIAAFTTAAAAVEGNTATQDQARFHAATRNFSTYATAKRCLTGLPMFGPKDISDSKALLSRFSDSPYKETAKRIVEAYDDWRNRLVKAYNKLGSASGSTSARPWFAVSSPTTDPVVED